MVRSPMRPILETPRLVLREMTDADAPLALGQNPNVMRYVPGEPPVLEKVGLIFEGEEQVAGRAFAVYVLPRDTEPST